MIDKELNYGRHILKKVLLRFNTKTILNFNCLDIGAGSGKDLDIVCNAFPEAKTIAIEGWKENVKLLKSKGHAVHQINIEEDDFPIATNSMDFIIANQILEHCKEIFWIFHEATRVLKVGGILYIGVPNLDSLHSRILLLFGFQPTCIRNNSAHIRGFTYFDIVNFINTTFPNGYHVESVTGSNFYPFPPFLAKILSKFFPLQSATIFLELKKIKDYDNSILDFPIGLETNFYLGKKSWT